MHPDIPAFDRRLRPAFLSLLIVLLGGCNDGGGETVRPEPIVERCDSTSYLDNGTCRIFAARIDARATTPFSEDGAPVELEVVLFRPLDEGRYPTLVMHHGSTGNGSDPSKFADTFTHKGLARYFVERGWMVAFPQRRGRGRSDGLYDEGFAPDRSGYSCNAEHALAGADRALDDLDVITDWLRLRADVDTTRMLVGGVSRGGILAVNHVAKRPDVFLAAINFVGGWISEGCGDHLEINRRLFLEGAAFPGTSLWLYAADDSFYSLPYSRANFEAFSRAGGMGEFLEFRRADGLNGHFIINDVERWSDAMSDFLDRL